MAQNKSSSRKAVSAPDPEQPVGRNLYFDAKHRMIYVSPLLREALYLPKYDYKKFNRYKSRFLIAIAAFMILGTAFSEWFEWPLWISIVLSLLIFAGIEFSFYKFQKTLTVVKNFDKAEATPTVNSVISPDMRAKCWLKIVLYIVLGVLLVVNAYDQHYDLWLLIACYVAMVYCLFIAGTLIWQVMKSPKA